jgi:ATP-binding cassette, subfamily C, bacterial CydCD
VPVRGVQTSCPDPSRQAIDVRDLEVRYAGRDEPALSGCSLRVEAGELLAVAGPSGSGKSTLLRVLAGLTVPTGGSVHVGEVDLRALDPPSWWGRLTWVPQRPTLFAGSVADNVRLGNPDVTDAAVWEALEVLGLGPELHGRGLGLATVLGPGGEGLSAGQRQRVALARALVSTSPLVLLDEPTASIDGDTEEVILDVLVGLAAGRTMVIAAHRPSLLAIAQRCVVLGDAAVVSGPGAS